MENMSFTGVRVCGRPQGDAVWLSLLFTWRPPSLSFGKFSEHLLCAEHFSKRWDAVMKEADIPAVVEPPVTWQEMGIKK